MGRLLSVTKHQAGALAHVVNNHYKRIFTRLGQILIWFIKFSIIVGISFIVISPILGIISKAFMNIKDYYNPLVYLVPMNYTLANMDYAIKYMGYSSSLLFTTAFCLLIMVIQGIICALVGYGFARYKFPGSGILFGLVVLTIIVPVQTMMAPMYIQFRYFNPLGIVSLLSKSRGVNFINSIWPSVIMSTTGMGLRSGLFIFIYRQFFKGLPKEIEEAAFIDGASAFRTFFQVMLPNARSSIIIVLLFAFVWQYNDTYFSGVLMSGQGLLAMRVEGLQSVLSQVQYIKDPNQIALIINSSVVLFIVPLIILYLFMQRYFMEGIERSGIVG